MQATTLPLLRAPAPPTARSARRSSPRAAPRPGLSAALPPLGRRARNLRVRASGGNKGFGKKEAAKGEEGEAPPPPPDLLNPVIMTKTSRQPEVRGIAQVGQDGQVEEVPAIVYDRMLSRILKFAGIPMLFGFGTGPLLYYLRIVQGIEVPPALAISLPTGAFGAALLGISYGVISTSWNAEDKGSATGWNEFQANLPILLRRLPFAKKD